MNVQHPSFITSLIAGGCAGIAVDVSLFPLDTLKTRLQSPVGFWKSGGLKNLYKGLGPAFIGSAPIAGLFFCTYDMMKRILTPHTSELYHPIVHMGAASIGEIVSCVAKVPTEVVKQRTQTGGARSSPLAIIRQTVAIEGFLGLYQGFVSTVIREIPFVLIQFPVWEFLKTKLKDIQNKKVDPLEGALCGAVAGGITAAITTPLDVIKTRIMLTRKSDVMAKDLKVMTMCSKIYLETGIKGLFIGFVPRVIFVSVGGLVFFGVYEFTKYYCTTFPWGTVQITT